MEGSSHAPIPAPSVPPVQPAPPVPSLPPGTLAGSAAPAVPPMGHLRIAINAYVAAANLRKTTVGQVMHYLQSVFGPGVRTVKLQVRRLLEEAVNARPEDDADEDDEEEQGVSEAAAPDGGSDSESSESEESSDETASRSRSRSRGAKRKAPLLWHVDPKLIPIVGEEWLPYTEAVKRIRAYVREHNLKDPTNGQYILLDDAMCHAFGAKKRMKSFSLASALSSLLKRSDELVGAQGEVDEEDGGSEAAAEEDDEDCDAEPAAAAPRKAKASKKASGGASGGWNKALVLHPSLAKACGVARLGRAKLVGALWQHIREKNLQDPRNRSVIKCDTLLKDAFGCDSMGMFRMNKLIKRATVAPEACGGDASSFDWAAHAAEMDREIAKQDGGSGAGKKRKAASNGTSGAERGSKRSRGS